MESKHRGLTQQQVQEQIDLGHVNTIPKQKNKSDLQIVLGHTFNLFNLYNVIIAGFLIAVQEYLSVFFLNVIIMNIGIRSYQEIRSKKIVENLNILIAADTKVIRDGKLIKISPEEVVLGDYLYLQIGDQVAADSVVVEDNVEMNESLLTGESEAVMKYPGSELLSGSFVTSGTCVAQVVRVGKDSFAQKITVEARQHEPVKSELMEAFMRVTRWCVRIVLPIGIILVFQSMVIRGESLRFTVLSTSTVLLGLLPKGLILLTSLSFGVSVFRLGKQRTLVQEIYSIETLSKVDVLCIDKTGTLTKGEMAVEKIINVESLESVNDMMSRYMSNTRDTDFTTLAMKKYVETDHTSEPSHTTPFSSSRKWGSMCFDDLGTIFVGAPEFLIPNYILPDEALNYQSQGARVLLLAFTPEFIRSTDKPTSLKPYGVIIISDPIREDVYDALDFFKNNEVIVKVISGDNIKTLTAVASKTGIINGHRAYDVSECTTDEELEYAVMNYNVIGRASPYQKQTMVKLLQKNGERVAMVGDGVNDVLALRSADCSIAMGGGSEAARQAAQIILLDNEFKTMVDVVMEGRLVTNNISRSASMYYLGTLLTFLLAIVSIVMNTSYPFTPLQISVMSMFVEGMPSTFVTFESNYTKPKGNIMVEICRNIIPNGMTMATLFVIILLLPLPLPVRHTMIYFVTVYLSFMLVVRAFHPMDLKRVGVLLLSSFCLISVCYVFYRQLMLVHLNPIETQLCIALTALSTVILLLYHKVFESYLKTKNYFQ